MACVRSVEAGEGEDEERSLPVGERRRRVWSWGVVLEARKVERALVRSIVCAMMVAAIWEDVGFGHE